MPTPVQTPQRRLTIKAADAEALVASALVAQGWQILARNIRNVGYELDLVAAKQQTVVIVEVRSRRDKPRHAHHYQNLLPYKKRQALRRGAEAIVTRLDLQFSTLRIDLAVVYRDEANRPAIDYQVHVISDH